MRINNKGNARNCNRSPANGSSSSLLVDGKGSSRIPLESVASKATLGSLAEDMSAEAAAGELESACKI